MIKPFQAASAYFCDEIKLVCDLMSVLSELECSSSTWTYYPWVAQLYQKWYRPLLVLSRSRSSSRTVRGCRPILLEPCRLTLVVNSMVAHILRLSMCRPDHYLFSFVTSPPQNLDVPTTSNGAMCLNSKVIMSTLHGRPSVGIIVDLPFCSTA